MLSMNVRNWISSIWSWIHINSNENFCFIRKLISNSCIWKLFLLYQIHLVMLQLKNLNFNIKNSEIKSRPLINVNAINLLMKRIYIIIIFNA